MYVDSMKDVGKGFLFGYKYLEYEMKYNLKDWKVLSEFLLEIVRFFKEVVKFEIILFFYYNLSLLFLLILNIWLYVFFVYI